jgi:hypothetical protein
MNGHNQTSISPTQAIKPVLLVQRRCTPDDDRMREHVLSSCRAVHAGLQPPRE